MPIINSLQSEEIRFILRKTNHPKSQLSNEAREQLFLDALHLEKTWLKRKLDGFREEAFTSLQSRKTSLQYSGKLLAEHDQVTPGTVSRIVKLGRRTSLASARLRSGRRSTFTPVHQQHILKKNNQVGGCSIRTLQALVEADPPAAYTTQYKVKERNSPGSNTLWRLLH